MDIRLKTYFTNPLLPYVGSGVVARDTFERTASDLTTTPIGGLAYQFDNSAGLSPIAATDGNLAYFRTGVGSGSSYCTVMAPPADLFQITASQIDSTERGSIIALQFGSPTRWLAALRVSKENPTWRIARNEGAGAQTLTETGITMTAGDSFRREYVNGALRVRINGNVVWSGEPITGAARAGFGLFPGTAWSGNRWKYLSVNYTG